MFALKSIAKSIVPYSVRHYVRGTYSRAVHSKRWGGIVCDLHDRIDSIRGRRDPLTPPRKLVYGIGGSLEIANQFLNYFRDWGRLLPTDAVLDVGCGIGRMALPLTNYLTPPGRYEGFDIMRANVDWCTSAITPRKNTVLSRSNPRVWTVEKIRGTAIRT